MTLAPSDLANDLEDSDLDAPMDFDEDDLNDDGGFGGGGVFREKLSDEDDDEGWVGDK